MSTVIPVIAPPEIQEDQLSSGLEDSFLDIPEIVFLIRLGRGRYVAQNATMPDLGELNGLTCFLTKQDAEEYQARAKEGTVVAMRGEVVAKSWEEARQIAISKPLLSCLFILKGTAIIDVHFVR